MVTALYPGTFDPATLGHVDLIRRAARLFDKVIVGVAENRDKSLLFTLEERVALLEQVVSGLENVRVIGFNNLLIDCVREQNA
ncbi:MAG TPA: phosphopantetheine adenylyltransferase, partial [Gammaproteobacteria bacterium]|nr:phosphopantetheine adenylyltransferase [Gammaproteobacteria bacterium]